MDIAELELPQQKGPKTRASVSAEAYGAFNQKKEYVPEVIPKDEDTKQRILQRLMQAFMFSSLEEKERNIVLSAMKEVNFEENEFVIKQGDDGDVLYVVDKGSLHCFINVKKEDQIELLKVKEYSEGESFGELALLYNAPRAASIKAMTPCTLFSLDRACFNAIVKDSAQKRRERFDEVLQKVDLLSEMEPYERTQICDALKSQRYEADEFVIKQGETGDNFYIVEYGKLEALKEGYDEVVFSYQMGDYFGELALLNDIPRQASIQAKETCSVFFLDKQSFKRLLGPIEDLLKRNKDKYAKYMNE